MNGHEGNRTPERCLDVTAHFIPVLDVAWSKAERVRAKLAEQDPRIANNVKEFVGGFISAIILQMDNQMFPPTIALAGSVPQGIPVPAPSQLNHEENAKRIVLK